MNGGSRTASMDHSLGQGIVTMWDCFELTDRKFPWRRFLGSLPRLGWNNSGAGGRLFLYRQGPEDRIMNDCMPLGAQMGLVPGKIVLLQCFFGTNLVKLRSNID